MLYNCLASAIYRSRVAFRNTVSLCLSWYEFESGMKLIQTVPNIVFKSALISSILAYLISMWKSSSKWVLKEDEEVEEMLHRRWVPVVWYLQLLVSRQAAVDDCHLVCHSGCRKAFIHACCQLLLLLRLIIVNVTHAINERMETRDLGLCVVKVIIEIIDRRHLGLGNHHVFLQPMYHCSHQTITDRLPQND